MTINFVVVHVSRTENGLLKAAVIQQDAEGNVRGRELIRGRVFQLSNAVHLIYAKLADRVELLMVEFTDECFTIL